MKLLYYTYRKLFFFLSLLLVGWGVLFYFAILEEIINETDNSLENYREIIVRHALRDSTVLESHQDIMTRYKFSLISREEAKKYKERFYDSTIYIEIEDEYEPVRVMKSCFRMPDGRYYELEIMLSITEREDMVKAILYYLLALFVMLFASMMLTTRFILKEAFRPLDRLMAWIKKIEPGKEVSPLENDTTIKEFEELGKAAVDMGNRSFRAYQQQKQFIENASHELQTPLAIACNKIELFVDSYKLNKKQIKELDDVYTLLEREVKLNKSLLLLSRIENGQYTEVEEINANELVGKVMSELTEIYEKKNIQTRLVENGTLIFKCSKPLIRIMIANLLKNALLHNKPEGDLLIEISDTALVIKNTGDNPLDEEHIFERFYHPQSENKDSAGLGLAIARSIALACNLNLAYSWDGMHCFTLSR